MFLNSVSSQVAGVGKASGRGKSAEVVDTGIRLEEIVEACEMVYIYKCTVKNLRP